MFGRASARRRDDPPSPLPSFCAQIPPGASGNSVPGSWGIFGGRYPNPPGIFSCARGTKYGIVIVYVVRESTECLPLKTAFTGGRLLSASSRRDLFGYQSILPQSAAGAHASGHSGRVRRALRLQQFGRQRGRSDSPHHRDCGQRRNHVSGGQRPRPGHHPGGQLHQSQHQRLHRLGHERPLPGIRRGGSGPDLRRHGLCGGKWRG